MGNEELRAFAMILPIVTALDKLLDSDVFIMKNWKQKGEVWVDTKCFVGLLKVTQDKNSKFITNSSEVY